MEGYNTANDCMSLACGVITDACLYDMYINVLNAHGTFGLYFSGKSLQPSPPPKKINLGSYAHVLTTRISLQTIVESLVLTLVA